MRQIISKEDVAESLAERIAETAAELNHFITQEELAEVVCNHVSVNKDEVSDVIQVTMDVLKSIFLYRRERQDSDFVTLSLEGLEGLCIGREKDFFVESIQYAAIEAEEKIKELMILKARCDFNNW